MIRTWKTITRNVLLTHPRITIVEDTVELPNGHITTYVREAPSITQSVAVMAFNSSGKLLVQREYSYPPHAIMYQLPGGSVLTGETIEEAASRELSEESGYEAAVVTRIGVMYVNNRRSDAQQYVVICTDIHERKLLEDDEEFIESMWLSMDEVQTLVRRGKIENINMLAALALYRAHTTNQDALS